jgi:Mg-chelatase subunit ChlD
MNTITQAEQLKRWRLILGGPADSVLPELNARDANMDQCLTFLYETKNQKGGREKSAPKVARWLGDIRNYFPSSVVQVMQKDAYEKLSLNSLLSQPEMLNQIQPDVHLVANLISLSHVIPEKTKSTARLVVKKVVDELIKKLDEPMRSAVTGALDKSQRNMRPKHSEIDWNKTIKANLKHYQEEYKTIIPQTLYGYGRKIRKPQREVILCIDQSGSMANSVVYSSIFGAVMASIPTVATRLVVFDTAVVDLTEKLSDPVDVLFGVQLGGGTDINKALTYCQSQIREPKNTIMILISDLYEGGVEAGLLKRAQEMIESGVQLITLLALSDEGRPSYDKDLADKLANLGVPSFACSPDLFPTLMACAIKREDINQWAATQGIITSRGQNS